MRKLIGYFMLYAWCILGVQAQDRVIRIPVVVHVIYSDSAADNGINDASRNNGNNTMYLPKSKIEAELADLHRDFLLLNQDTARVLSDFKKSIGNPKVDFYLAEVKYVKAKRSTIAAPANNSKRLAELSPIVDSKKHLNVYLSTIRVGGRYSNGVATVKTFRGAGGAQDAVFLNYRWVGLGYRLLTHEVGHWLGLWHPWTKAQADDGVDDIPLQAGPTHTPCELCPPDVQDRVKPNTRFTHSNYNNFMDYSGCRVMFSKKQAKRIRKVLTDFRPELLNPSCGL